MVYKGVFWVSTLVQVTEFLFLSAVWLPLKRGHLARLFVLHLLHLRVSRLKGLWF